MTDAETTKFIISPQLKKMLCSELQPADIVELVACLEVEEVHERMPRFKLFLYTHCPLSIMLFIGLLL